MELGSHMLNLKFVQADILIFVLLLSTICIVTINTSDLDGVSTLGGPLWRTDERCATVSTRRIKGLVEGVMNCSQAMGIKNMKERDVKIYCILKCTAINEGFLTTEGLVNWGIMEAFVTKEIPPDHLPRVLPLFRKCFDLADGNLDPMEELCKSYKPFSMCIIDATAMMCKERKEVTTFISVTD